MYRTHRAVIFAIAQLSCIRSWLRHCVVAIWSLDCFSQSDWLKRSETVLTSYAYFSTCANRQLDNDNNPKTFPYISYLFWKQFCLVSLHTCAAVWNNKKAELSQRRPRDAPHIWVPWKVLRVLTTHPATAPEIFNGLLFRSILRMCVQNLKFVALPVPEIIGGTQKNLAVPGYAHAPFSPKILKGFCSDGPSEYICQIWRS